MEQFVLYLKDNYGITPNKLTYIRIFAAPWLALLISKVLSDKSALLAVITIILYLIIVSTDYLDGLLARKLPKEENDHAFGGMLDRVSDKILIILLLIPFGLNIFTFSIVLGESILLYQALFSPSHQKQAKTAGKIKMLFQTFLIPIYIIGTITNIIPDSLVFLYISATVVLTFISIYSHYFKND